MFTRKATRDSVVGGGPAATHGVGASNGGPPPLSVARPAPAPRSSSAASAGASVVGADLSITGNLESRGEIQIEGEVQGDIHAARIVVGEHARITGNLLAEEIVVRGNVAGSIRGNNITLQSESRVEGDVFHRSLAIEQGAFFEGKSRRSDDPMAVQRAAQSIPPPG